MESVAVTGYGGVVGGVVAPETRARVNRSSSVSVRTLAFNPMPESISQQPPPQQQRIYRPPGDDVDSKASDRLAALFAAKYQ